MTKIVRDPVSITTAIYVSASGSAASRGRSQTNPTTIQNAIALFKDPQTRFSFNSGNYDIICLEGTYSLVDPIDFIELKERGLNVRFVGSGATPDLTIFERSGGDSRAVLRLFRASITLSNILVRSSTGTAIEVIGDGSNLQTDNVDFGATIGDCIHVGGSSNALIGGTTKFHDASPNTNAFLRSRNGASIDLALIADFNNQAWVFNDAVVNADAGRVIGALTHSNSGSVTGDQWIQNNGGSIILNSKSTTELDLPGTAIIRDRNQDADKLAKLSIETIATGINQVFASDSIPSEHLISPTADFTIFLDFSPTAIGWNTNFRTSDPSFTVVLIAQSGVAVGILGGASGYDNVKLIWNGTGFEAQNGAKSRLVQVDRGATVTLYYDNAIGDDRNCGLFSVRPIKTFKRLNELFNGYFLGNMDNPTGGSLPTINVVMADGQTSNGGLFQAPNIGTGKIVFNSSANASVGINSGMMLIGSEGLTVDVRNITFGTYGLTVFGSQGKNNRQLKVSVTSKKTSFSAFGGGQFPAEIVRNLLVDLNLSPGVKVIALGGRLNLINCTYQEAGAANAASPIVGADGADIQVLGGTYQATHAIAFLTGKSRIRIVDTPANQFTFDLAAAYTYRYLVNADDGCTVNFINQGSLGNTGDNATVTYLARMTGGGELKASYAWIDLVQESMLDALFMDGVKISDGGLINQILPNNPIVYETNTTYYAENYAGYSVIFKGAGIVGTVTLTNQQLKRLIGTTVRVSSVLGARIEIRNLVNIGGKEVVLNNAAIAVEAFWESTITAQTSIEIEYFSEDLIMIHVLEGTFTLKP